MLMCVLLLALPTLASAAVPAEPTWAVSPQNYVDGDAVTLTCTGVGTLTGFTIEKDGQAVTPSATAAQTAEVSIASYSSSDAGTYTCIVSNADGDSATAASQTVAAYIEKPTLTVTTPANNAAYVDGDNVVVTCLTSTAGTTYSFTKGGTATTDNIALGVMTFTTYSAATDAGTYKCKASKTPSGASALEVESDELVVGNTAVQVMTPMVLLTVCLLTASAIY